MAKKNVVKKDIVNRLSDPARFEKLSDGWIKDRLLGLDWGPSSAKEMTWKQAQEYCKKQGGRLPESCELETLTDRSKSNPAIYPIFADTKPSWYWSNTTVAWASGSAWCVAFRYGHVGSTSKGSFNSVRPVRSSQ